MGQGRWVRGESGAGKVGEGRKWGREGGSSR